MATKSFTYVAMDRQGVRQTGVLEAPSERSARATLIEKGFLVETLQEGLEAPPERGAFRKHVAAPLLGRVNLEALQRFFAQLLSMYRAGVPLHQALDTLARSQSHPKLRAVISDMSRHVLEGKSMSQAMEKYPEVFSRLQLSLVRVGETGGVLEKSLAQISDYLVREIRLRNNIKRAMFWPKLTLGFALLMPLLVNYIVMGISSRTGGPAFQIFSIASNALFVVALIAGIAGWLFFFRILILNPAVKQSWDAFVLAVPYIGGTIKMLTMAKFGRAFAALHGGGVPMGRTIAVAAEACGNEYIRHRVLPAASWINEGKGIGESFERTGVFTDIALQMTYTGEKSGNLEAMFENVADQYEDEAEVRIEKTSGVLRLAIILLVGLLVLYMLVAFYTSYFAALFQEVDEF